VTFLEDKNGSRKRIEFERKTSILNRLENP